MSSDVLVVVVAVVLLILILLGKIGFKRTNKYLKIQIMNDILGVIVK